MECVYVYSHKDLEYEDETVDYMNRGDDNNKLYSSFSVETYRCALLMELKDSPGSTGGTQGFYSSLYCHEGEVVPFLPSSPRTGF